MNELLTIIVGMVLAVGLPVLLLLYSNQYYKNLDGTTATNGIIWHNTINLENYTVLGQGTSMFCPNGHTIYSRSIRHETVNICN
jgi:hypothetical protein